MRSRSRALLLLLTACGLWIGAALPAGAAEVSNSEFVIIQEDDVLEDDLYAGAIKVTVDGVIDGDLIAFAGEEVVINGRVTGSVIAISPRVVVNGTVDGSVRANANDLVIEGHVGRDVVAAAVDVDLAPQSMVGNDVLVWSLSLSALGTVGGDVTGSQRRLEVAGDIGGDLDVSVGQVTVVDDLTVAGDFGYRSANEALGLEQADVGGAVVHKTPLPPNIRVRALNVFGSFLVILFLTIAALAVAWGWPDRTALAINAARKSAWSAWWRGALVILSPLLIALVAGLVLGLAPASASFPLLVILIPVVLAVFGLVMGLCLVAGVPAVGWLGSALAKRLDVYGAILVGSLLAGLVWLLPFVGWLVPVLVLPLGLGSWMLSWSGERAESQA